MDNNLQEFRFNTNVIVREIIKGGLCSKYAYFRIN